MNNIEISVIVPVYNGQKYLRGFLDSLIAQSNVKLEILLVDNGSSDQSALILEEYGQKDPRIKIITLKENQGVYGARNIALKQAKGQYIAFADCDDYICLDAYSILYKTVAKYDSDIVIGDFQHIYDSGEVISFYPQHTKCMFEPLMCGGAIWNKLFRRKLIEDNNIEFPPRNHMEDNVFLGRVYRCRPSIVIEHYDVYHYMQRMKDLDDRLTGSTYTSVVQSFESVRELYSEPLPCDDNEVFKCFWGALHYLRDLWFNMRDADDQGKTYGLFRQTIATLPWINREDFFYWCFKINYEDYTGMDYAQFMTSSLKASHREELRLQKQNDKILAMNATDIVMAQYENGEVGFRGIVRFVKAWFRYKRKCILGGIKGKVSRVLRRVKNITPVSIFYIFLQYTYRGYALYKRLLKTYGKDTHFLLIPYEGTGDAYLAGCLLKQYLQAYSIKEYLILQPLSRGKKVLALFGEERIHTISIEERNWLSQFQLFCGQVLNNLHVIHFHPCNHVCILNQVEGINGITFREMYELKGFDFGSGEKPSCLAEKSALISEFEKENLLPQKTVVLAPYAETIPSMPNDCWVYIANVLKKKGYCVCTNSSGKSEPVIPGTKRVFYSYSEMIPALEVAGYFIGVRSGLCDIISSAQCKKIIVYPKGFLWGKGPVSSYFSLNKMQLCDDATEVEFDCENWKETTDLILATF